MPVESLSCPNCGSGNIQQVKPEMYFCNHCDNVFRYVNPSRAATSAGCEVLVAERECGVPAIGRCTVDRRAFCATHQGRSFTGFIYVDRCQPCQTEAEDAKRDHELRFGQSYLVNSARNDLKSADIATIQIYSIRTENQVRSFGRSRFVEHLEPWATGWIIGTFTWEYYEGPYGGTKVKREWLTVLIDEKASSSNDYTDRNLARISKDADRGVFLIARLGGYIERPYEEISRAIHRMTE